MRPCGYIREAFHFVERLIEITAGVFPFKRFCDGLVIVLETENVRKSCITANRSETAAMLSPIRSRRIRAYLDLSLNRFPAPSMGLALEVNHAQ